MINKTAREQTETMSITCKADQGDRSIVVSDEAANGKPRQVGRSVNTSIAVHNFHPINMCSVMMRSTQRPPTTDITTAAYIGFENDGFQ
jgi:hypothetical protein